MIKTLVNMTDDAIRDQKFFWLPWAEDENAST